MIPEELPKSSDIFTQIITWIWVITLSSFGGTVAYLNKLKEHRQKFIFIRFIGEIITSAFVGIITFLLCDAAGWGWQITAAMVAVSGHMGTRALFKMEKVWEALITKGAEDGTNSKEKIGTTKETN